MHFVTSRETVTEDWLVTTGLVETDELFLNSRCVLSSGWVVGGGWVVTSRWVVSGWLAAPTDLKIICTTFWKKCWPLYGWVLTTSGGIYETTLWKVILKWQIGFPSERCPSLQETDKISEWEMIRMLH